MAAAQGTGITITAAMAVKKGFKQQADLQDSQREIAMTGDRHVNTSLTLSARDTLVLMDYGQMVRPGYLYFRCPESDDESFIDVLRGSTDAAAMLTGEITSMTSESLEVLCIKVAHGLTTGDTITIIDVDSTLNNQVAGEWTITVQDANSFTLDGSVTTASENDGSVTGSIGDPITTNTAIDTDDLPYFWLTNDVIARAKGGTDREFSLVRLGPGMTSVAGARDRLLRFKASKDNIEVEYLLSED